MEPSRLLYLQRRKKWCKPSPLFEKALPKKLISFKGIFPPLPWRRWTAVGTEGGEKNEDLWWKLWLSPDFLDIHMFASFPCVKLWKLWELKGYNLENLKLRVWNLILIHLLHPKNNKSFHHRTLRFPVKPHRGTHNQQLHFPPLFRDEQKHRSFYDSTLNSTKPRQKLLQWLSIPSSQSFAALKKNTKKTQNENSFNTRITVRKHLSRWWNVFFVQKFPVPNFFPKFFCSHRCMNIMVCPGTLWPCTGLEVVLVKPNSTRRKCSCKMGQKYILDASDSSVAGKKTYSPNGVFHRDLEWYKV